MPKRIVLAAVLAASGLHAASAENIIDRMFTLEPADGGGLFISGYVGSSSIGDANFSGVQAPVAGAPGAAGAPANVAVEFDSDAVFGGAVGYQAPLTYWTYFQPRLELEVSSLTADVSDGSFNGGDQPFSGELETTMFLVNNYSDIRWSEDQLIVPFIGGGLGVAQVEADIPYAGGTPEPNFTARGDDTVLASTIAAGVTLDLPGAVDLYGEARYHQLFGVELERRFVGGGADLFSAALEEDVTGANFTVGARYRF